MANQKKINPYYIAGFVDGEGCFGLQFRKDVRHERPGSPIYYSWIAQFTIVARADERELFEKIYNFFKCGNIYNQKKDNFRQGEEIHYCVSKLEDLRNTISPFFNEYQLQGKKRNDFELWAEAIDIMYKNKKEHVNAENGTKGFLKKIWRTGDMNRLLEIHSEMQKYKSKRLQGFKHIHIAQSLFHSDPDKK